jgi:cholesterol transport system auxiliary component
MLTPLIVRTLENSGAFRAVVRGSTSAASELRLDTEVIRLQQEFNVSPSQVRFTLRAVMVDTATRRVVAASEFEAIVASPTEDATGGVIAANQAVGRVLADLTKFSIEAAAMKSSQARP